MRGMHFLEHHKTRFGCFGYEGGSSACNSIMIEEQFHKLHFLMKLKLLLELFLVLNYKIFKF